MPANFLLTEDRHLEEALALVEAISDYEGLSQVQELVFREAWRDKPYSEIATTAGYDAEYIKAVGFKLWQLLSKVLAQKVTKNNFKFILRRCLQLQSANNDRPSMLEQEQPSVLAAVSPVKLPSQYQNWGTAMDVSVFYGRTQELETLENWIVSDRCRLVALLGMVGIGKTALSIKLAQQIQANFEYIIWRSVRNAPPIESFLNELIEYLANQQDLHLPATIDNKLSILMHLLQQHRCLIVLDNFESLLQSGNSLRTYRTGYEAYGQLLKQVGEESHQSCVLLTSR